MQSEWGTHVNPWLIHINVWQKPLQYCKVISLQLIKVNGKNKKKNPHAMQETWVPSLGWEDPLEKGTATHSCLENSMDRGAWQATIHGVTKSLTRLNDFHFSTVAVVISFNITGQQTTVCLQTLPTACGRFLFPFLKKFIYF